MGYFLPGTVWALPPVSTLLLTAAPAIFEVPLEMSLHITLNIFCHLYLWEEIKLDTLCCLIMTKGLLMLHCLDAIQEKKNTQCLNKGVDSIFKLMLVKK